MKIYKISQYWDNLSLPVWLAQELINRPSFHISPSYLKLIQKWVNETNPDLNNYDLGEAYTNACRYINKIKNEIQPDQIIKNANENKKDMAEQISAWYPEEQSINPDDVFITDIREDLVKKGWYILTVNYPSPTSNEFALTGFKTQDGRILFPSSHLSGMS